ncbi:MAG: hypothetical protein JW995_15470 [Melioribacteraceae bacterium]|nr:hypothetical protein [Melioribacteraceae bacterium]
MKHSFISITVLVFLLNNGSINAQNRNTSYFESFNQKRNLINETAMIVLGSWAAGNILIGTYGNIKAKGEAKYFNQFNMMWNVANLGIAAFGYINSLNSDLSGMSNLEILKDYNSLQSFLLLNAGLDIAYIVTGMYLKELAKKSSKAARLRGYGNSLLLQGGFLLAFDVILFFLHRQNASVNIYPYLDGLLAGGMGVEINFKL